MSLSPARGFQINPEAYLNSYKELEKKKTNCREIGVLSYV